MSAVLSDHVDRLSQLATSISLKATSEDNAFNPINRPSVAGPFTRAILSTSLGDLIRDIDPSELGLFTLVQQPQPGSAPAAVRGHEGEAGGSSAGEITRVGFVGATPLRKPPMRKDGTQQAREHEPEVYAHAALKYLDKYHTLRPMPRAVDQVERILEELAAVRESIDSLSEKLLQANDTGSTLQHADPKTMAMEEERRIEELQNDIAELRKHKEAILKRKTGIRSAAALTPKRKSQLSKTIAASLLTPSSPDAAEHSFWNTPAAAARTLQFIDDSLLTDEHMDLSAPSLASPLTDERKPPMRSRMPPRASARQLVFEPALQKDWKAVDPEPNPAADESFEHIQPQAAGDDDENDVAEDDDDDDDKTVMIGAKAPSEPEAMEDEVTFELPAAPSPPPAADDGTQRGSRKQKFKITEEMEVVVSKIWATVGEVIMPGNPFDLNGSGIGVKPPRAKETLGQLQQLATQTAFPNSPDTSSISSASGSSQLPGATAQQVLIAHVLLSLLSSPPSYSMSLNKLKDTLANKNGGITAQAVTRPIYSCVAKKLLRIDRGGGEQVVRFDL